MYRYGYDSGRKGCQAKFWLYGRTLKVKVYGSDHWYDWLINFNAWPMAGGLHPGWKREAVDLMEYIDETGLDYDSVEIIGLSAGGAIGAIMVLYSLRPAVVTTVNSPSFGARWRIDELGERLTALSHKGDIVRFFPVLYAKPAFELYGEWMWFWRAHNDTPREWKEF